MKILFVSGSLRKSSLNTQLAQAAADLLKDQAETTFLNWSEVPVFNQDLEFPTPAPVQAVRDAFLAADGVWFFTPEYNQQIPGGLKNLTDWLSRPMTEGASWKDTALRDRKAAISGIGGAGATKGSRQLLEKVLTFTGMKVLPDSQGFSMTPEEMKTGKLVVTEDIRTRLAEEGEAFVKFIAE